MYTGGETGRLKEPTRCAHVWRKAAEACGQCFGDIVQSDRFYDALPDPSVPTSKLPILVALNALWFLLQLL